jgi:hypothetical protein
MGTVLSGRRRRSCPPLFFEMVRHEEGDIYQTKKNKKKVSLRIRNTWRCKSERSRGENNSCSKQSPLAGWRKRPKSKKKKKVLTKTLLEIQPRITKRLKPKKYQHRFTSHPNPTQPQNPHKTNKEKKEKEKNPPDTSIPTPPRSTPYSPQDTLSPNTPPHSTPL